MMVRRLLAATVMCVCVGCETQVKTEAEKAPTDDRFAHVMMPEQHAELPAEPKPARQVEKGAEGTMGKKEAAGKQGVLTVLGGVGVGGGGRGALGGGLGHLGTRGYGSGAGSGAMLAKRSAGVVAYGRINSGAASNVFGPGGLGTGINNAIGELNDGDSEDYGHTGINPWVDTEKDALSTFAADVDTASYTVARRKLLGGNLPPQESVRVEEWLNYFRYSYPEPTREQGALNVVMDAAPSPFADGKTILRVGVQARRLAVNERKPAHLTFLVDVSGSMQGPDRLPLAKRALRMLVDNLRDGDTVALVTYAGNVGLALPPTGMEQKSRIHEAIEALNAGGSTAMSSGIELAYAQAARTLNGDSISRVIVLSDGDANVGSTTHEQILKLIQGHVKEGVTLTTVGFGMGNYKDGLMEQLADKGNGNHFYCDSLFEAHRIFVEQLGGTLEVVAQDVKFQVNFDSKQVARYRLVGYENRDIADRDFRNDKVDAGEVGSGHSVTAVYELELRPGAGAGLATVRVRAKKPRGVEAAESAFAFQAASLHRSVEAAGKDFQFATAVMGAAEIFRQSPHAKGWSYDRVVELARGATPERNAERMEFVALLQHAKTIATQLASR